MLRNTRERWGSVTKTLHWVLAIAILTMFVLGWVAVSWPLSPTKIKLFSFHKSLGVTILTLVVIRLLWRLGSQTPALPEQMRSLERKLAHSTHAFLYMLMLAMPISGWVINSAANFPLKVFGVFRLPDIAPHDKGLQTLAENVHLTIFWILLAVLLLHIAGALKHHFVDKDDVLKRMWPNLRP